MKVDAPVDSPTEEGDEESDESEGSESDSGSEEESEEEEDVKDGRPYAEIARERAMTRIKVSHDHFMTPFGANLTLFDRNGLLKLKMPGHWIL